MKKNRVGRIAMVLALAMVLLVPASALATSKEGNSLSLGCGFGVDESAMSADQQVTRVTAVDAYYAAEDEVLAGLVTAGSATQADVDRYQTGRDARWTLTQMDKSGWTAEQTAQYEAASQLSGTERDAAADALVASGQLISEQGAALKVSATNTSRSIALTDASAVTTATTSLEALRTTLKQTLTDAGITISNAGSGGSADRGGKGGGQQETAPGTAT